MKRDCGLLSITKVEYRPPDELRNNITVYASPPRITQRTMKLIVVWEPNVDQFRSKHACVWPSGEESGKMTLGLTNTQWPLTSIS
jgi:hypothetical protein